MSKVFGERVSPGPANQRSFPCLLCCWGAIAIKRHPWSLWLFMLCLSPYQRFFLRTRFVMSFAKDKGQSLNAAALKPVSKQRHLRQTSEPKSSLILTGGSSLWPICASVQGGYSRIRCSIVCIHSTLSEDTSEVLVQPLNCGIEKANSMARVVVKPTPRLCNRCASNT